MTDDVLVFHEEETTLQGDVLVVAVKQPPTVVDFNTGEEVLSILTSGQIGPQGQVGEQGVPGEATNYDNIPNLSLIFENGLV